MCNIIKFDKTLSVQKPKFYYICFGDGNFMHNIFDSFDKAYSTLCDPGCSDINTIYKTTRVAIFESVGDFDDNGQILRKIWSSSNCNDG